MKERPILFSAPMVQSILEGQKTQTRRIVKPPVYFGCLTGDCPHETQYECNQAIAGFAENECKHGSVGDRLWVKETHARVHEGLLQRLDPEPDNGSAFNNGWSTAYRADGEPANWEHYGIKWKPSIFCTRKFSRIDLEITGVRVERLKDISEEDALAEGVQPYTPHVTGMLNGREQELPSEAYKNLWESINGPGSWQKNPWVWVIEFKRIRP